MGLFDFLKPTPVSKRTTPAPRPAAPKKPAAAHSGVDCYNYNGSVENYFADVLARNFPGYDIRRNVALESLLSPGRAASAASAAPASGWDCACGNHCTGAFCPECGSRKPVPKPAPAPTGNWTCPSCGSECAGKFCPECGGPRPVSNEWVCSCGAKNKGKFCPECGSRKPEASAPVYATPAVPVSAPAPAGKSTGFALSYVLYQSGMPKMAVILCPKNSYQRKDILQAMDGCKGKGIPCLRFFREFRNDEAYIRSRISQTLR